MAHQRQVIRAAIAAVLLGATSAGANVFATRTLPYRAVQDLPAIAVYTLSEDVEGDSRLTAPRELTRNLSVIVEGWVNPGTNVDDAIDALALEIETAMHADPYLGAQAVDCILSSTVMEAIEDGERELGFLAMTYDVTYRTLAPEPLADADMDDFDTAGATYDLGGVQAPADEANDEITVQA